jgi:cytidylate kinase
VAEVNHQREQYVKRHWHRDWRDLTNYDICVNTARLGLDGAADLVIHAARKLFT